MLTVVSDGTIQQPDYWFMIALLSGMAPSRMSVFLLCWYDYVSLGKRYGARPVAKMLIQFTVSSRATTNTVSSKFLSKKCKHPSLWDSYYKGGRVYILNIT